MTSHAQAIVSNLNVSILKLLRPRIATAALSRQQLDEELKDLRVQIIFNSIEDGNFLHAAEFLERAVCDGQTGAGYDEAYNVHIAAYASTFWDSASLVADTPQLMRELYQRAELAWAQLSRAGKMPPDAPFPPVWGHQKLWWLTYLPSMSSESTSNGARDDSIAKLVLAELSGRKVLSAGNGHLDEEKQRPSMNCLNASPMSAVGWGDALRSTADAVEDPRDESCSNVDEKDRHEEDTRNVDESGNEKGERSDGSNHGTAQSHQQFRTQRGLQRRGINRVVRRPDPSDEGPLDGPLDLDEHSIAVQPRPLPSTTVDWNRGGNWHRHTLSSEIAEMVISAMLQHLSRYACQVYPATAVRVGTQINPRMYVRRYSLPFARTTHRND